MHLSDQEIHKTIIEEFRDDPSIEAARITVTVGNGAVRLSGEVASLPEKLAVKRSAIRIRGVKAVADDMTVASSGTTDAEIADSAQNRLRSAAGLPMDAVKADVRNHVITLSGTVAWGYQRDAASRAVTNMRGVTAVNNQIVVT
jgi:osmotically-inducible protein OsmY